MNNSERRNPKQILNAGIEQMCAGNPDEAQISGSAERVLSRLRTEHSKVVPYPAANLDGGRRITSCDDFQALMPAFLTSSLTPSRKLLLEDHIHECVFCRKALDAARSGKSDDSGRAVAFVPRGRRSSIIRWGAAAALAAVVVLAFQITPVRDLLWPIEVHAMVRTIDGGLYRTSGQTVQPVAAGEKIERSEVVRTGNESRAILELPDGSRVEMNAHSELWLDRARDGLRIHLNRGNVLVTAAKQHGGHLYVTTPEVGVSVVGTVFEVNAGVRGSRVTVLEGEVRVQQGAAAKSLHRGDQFLTDPGMATIPAQTEIGWSRELSKYLAFLDAAQTVAQSAAAIPSRNMSDLVPLVPADTVVFASLPNISQPLADSYQLFKQRIVENPTLSSWWQPTGSLSGLGPTLDQIMARVTQVGSYLGSEVVFAFPANPNAGGPVLLADTSSPDQLAAALTDAHGRVARNLDDVRSFIGTRGILFYVGDGLLIAAVDANQMLRSLQYRSQPETNGFRSTSLYSRLAEEYGQGIGWLLAADLERLIGNSPAAVQQTSLGSMRQLIVEQKQGPSGVAYRAALGFNQQRKGVAAWLAEPAPMGALDFISPSAYGVAGVITKDPSLMFDDIFPIIQGSPDANQSFLNYQAENRVDIKRDIVAPIGNEFLIAIDGPILPAPAWRMVIEVNDAARLQNTIEWAVNRINQEAVAVQKPGLVLTSETSAGHTFYSLKGANIPVEIHYTYWAGYVIVAPNQNMLMDAIQNHDTGNSLMRSAAFRSQLPADGNDYASGFIYQNIGMLTNSSNNNLPSLVALYGEKDQIVMTSKAVLGMNVGSIAGWAAMLKFPALH